RLRRQGCSMQGLLRPISKVAMVCRRAFPVAAVVVGAAAVVVAGLFTGFENAQSQRRPEKPRVASVHLRPRPVALPHLRGPLPVLGDGTQTDGACARRKHGGEHVRILQGRSLAAKETSMILPPRPIVEPEIADLSDLNSTTMRSDRGFASLWPRVLLTSGGPLTARLCPFRRSIRFSLPVGPAVQPTVGPLLCKATAKAD